MRKSSISERMEPQRVGDSLRVVDECEGDLASVVEFLFTVAPCRHRPPVVDDELRFEVRFGFELTDVRFIQSCRRFPINPMGAIPWDVFPNFRWCQAASRLACIVVAKAGCKLISPLTNVDVAWGSRFHCDSWC